MTATVIVAVGTATEVFSKARYLKTYDPDYVPDDPTWRLIGITGKATFTDDINEAMQFSDLAEAMKCWQTRSTRQPLRPDGQPNRPLTAYTITFQQVDPMTRPSEARERCIEASKHPVIRYVVTHIDKHGMRTLIGPAQGRFTYATPEQAQQQLDAIMQNNSQATLNEVYGLPLEVRPCKCWPGHFDPMGVYFDTDKETPCSSSS